jgi:hypothetical protein
MDLASIALPELPVRYDCALRAALVWVFGEFQPLGVVISGSILRGNPDASSDFDILVVHRLPWRRRVQKWFDGVPAEIFVNSTAWMDRYLEQEAADGRPVMADMLTTGTLVCSAGPEMGALIERARLSLERGACFSTAALQQRRYAAACLFEDALETADRDPATSALILGRAVEAAVAYWFASRQRFAPRVKDRLPEIREDEPETADLVEQSLLAGKPSECLAAAEALAERVIGHTGFFEWDSGPSESNPA